MLGSDEGGPERAGRLPGVGEEVLLPEDDEEGALQPVLGVWAWLLVRAEAGHQLGQHQAVAHRAWSEWSNFGIDMHQYS